jgi:hypothetical protein
MVDAYDDGSDRVRPQGSNSRLRRGHREVVRRIQDMHPGEVGWVAPWAYSQEKEYLYTDEPVSAFYSFWPMRVVYVECVATPPYPESDLDYQAIGVSHFISYEVDLYYVPWWLRWLIGG